MLSRRPWYFFAPLLLLLAVALALVAGCTTDDTPRSEFNITGNTGPVTVNTTTGSNSPASSAPCGVLGAPQKGTGQAAPTGDCSTNTAEPFFPPAAEPAP